MTFHTYPHLRTTDLPGGVVAVQHALRARSGGEKVGAGHGHGGTAKKENNGEDGEDGEDGETENFRAVPFLRCSV